MRRRLALGLDSGTQNLSAAIVDIDRREKVFEHSLDYARDTRLNGFGIRSRDYIIPPRVEGEADQPPELYFASLDVMFSDIRDAGVGMEDIVVINVSGQQHSHVYLNHRAQYILAELDKKDAALSDLVTLLQGCLAYGVTPIWMTSNTAEQARLIRERVGGKGTIIRLSGSNVPLRFTGVVIRRVAEQFPRAYEQTENIQLISSLIPAVLTGNSKVPVDFGNACGTSLMDYRHKRWSRLLIRATSDGLPGGESALGSKLPTIVSPDTIVGTIAMYFVSKYGFSPACKIVVGSGDNPQSKVLISGDLLSLGTSFVNMVSTNGETLDMNGFANAMYDGIGQPFLFGCRTNGAMVWDQLRAMYGMKKEDYWLAEEVLQRVPVANHFVFWQPRNESFPPSGRFDLVRIGHRAVNLGADYAGLIESTLVAVYHHSMGFIRETTEPLYVTGGAIDSPGIMRRLAAIWNRQVVPIEKGGAALGAAVAGVYAFLKSHGEIMEVQDFSTALLKRREKIVPKAGDVSAFHRNGGYLKRFEAEEAKLIKAHPPE